MAQKSYYSHIELITKDSQKFVEKSLTFCQPRSEVEEIRRKVLLQRDGLADAGVPISNLVDAEVGPTHNGETTLRFREEFAGLDFVDIVNSENAHMYIRLLLHGVYKPLLKSTSDDHLRVGIDPVLRNFVFNTAANEFKYVDFLPPKVFFSGEYTHELPELTDPDFREIRKYAHYSRRGIIYVTYINTVRVFPQLQRVVAAAFQQFLAEIGESDLFADIENSPIHRAHSAIELQRVLSGISSWKLPHYYHLRELANWIYSHNPEFAEDHARIFKLSHHVTEEDHPEYGQVSAENFTELKSLLQSGMKEIIATEGH